jgi:hypothetical protein
MMQFIRQSRRRYHWFILKMDENIEENLKKEIPLFPQKILDKPSDLCYNHISDEPGELHDI